MPNIAAIGDFGFVNADHFVLSCAYSDFVVQEKIGYDDWRKDGVVFGGGFSTPEYHFFCGSEINSLEELKGKNVRLPGAGRGRFGDSIGVISVAIPSNEIYTSLERGALDCIGIDATNLTSGPTIMELTKSIILADMMPGYLSAGCMYNPDWWKSLTDKQRRTLFDETARPTARMQIADEQEMVAAMDQARARGIKIVDDPEMWKAREALVANDIGGTSRVAKEQFKVEYPAALFALFQDYPDKWTKLLDGVPRDDEEAITTLVKENIFDTVDVATCGME